MIRWMTVTEAARYFGKDPSMIRRWCYTGAVVEFGFRVQRDLTGHWKIGVPVGTIQQAEETCHSCKS